LHGDAIPLEIFMNGSLSTISKSAAAATLLIAAGSAQAFQIETGNPDISLRWDNTLRYNVGMRVNQREELIGNTAITDEGTYSFNNGRIVTNRLDVLSEIDLTYTPNFGLRVSGAGWYDDAYYGKKSRSNPKAPLSTIPSYTGNEYSSYVKRYYAGPSGEVLDAFVFGKLHFAGVPVSVKAGRHAEFWGESLLLNGSMHSVAYSQSPLDLQKGFATPGVEAKELFRPLNNISAQAQLTDTLSVAGQYFLEWDSFRYPEGGTYLGPGDFVFNGPDRQFVSPGLGFAKRGNAVEPHSIGDWGLNARWSPALLNGTVGVYYRNYSDKLPQTLLTKVGVGTSVYNLIYADNISLYGLSFSKQVLGASVGAELSYRHNTPLNSKILGASPTGLPDRGETSGPRGDTMHAVVNVLGTIAKTPLFDAATWATEATWNNYIKVRSGSTLFSAEGYAPCAGKTKWDGCSTKNYVGLGMTFTPTWYQVFKDVDLLAPMSVSQGVSGNSSVVLGGNQGTGTYSAGIAADIHQAYRVDIKYVDYYGRINGNGTITSQNGLLALLRDRGFVALTIKATF
jgi:hypothetical protein